MTTQQQQNDNRIQTIVRTFMLENEYTFRGLAAEMSLIYPVSNVSLAQWALGLHKPNKKRLEFIRDNADDGKIKKFVEDMLAAVLITSYQTPE